MRKSRHFSSLQIEFGRDSMNLLYGEAGLRAGLERNENGGLTEGCKQAAISVLRQFLGPAQWRSEAPVLCAIPARGVSLRRLQLPNTSGDELERLLLFQIEKEFPLPPERLAWGWTRIPGARTGGGQELVVMAIRKDFLEDYAEIARGCGIDPAFTLAALVRSQLCAARSESFSVLEIGAGESELIVFKDGAPHSLAVLPWGMNEANDSLARTGNLGTLLDGVQKDNFGETLYISGGGPALKKVGAALGQYFGEAVPCDLIESSPDEGRSTATAALQQGMDNSEEPLLLRMTSRPRPIPAKPSPAAWKWAAMAAALVLASTGLRLAERIMRQKRLAKHVAELKVYRDTLPNLDRELSLAQYVSTNQPAYLDIIYNIATAAPQGTRIESLAINRRGELSIRGGMANPQQVVDFRTRLIDSGLFSTVVVDEQTPTPDRQKINVRISAICRPVAESKPKPPAAKDKVKGKPAATETKASPV